MRLEMAMPNLCVPELLENLHLVTATQRPHTAPLAATQPHSLRGHCQKVSWSSAFLLYLAAMPSWKSAAFLNSGCPAAHFISLQFSTPAAQQQFLLKGGLGQLSPKPTQQCRAQGRGPAEGTQPGLGEGS